MKRATANNENRELAYRVWALFGGRDIERVLMRLERVHGLKISRKTLYRWRAEGGWQGRLALHGPDSLLTFNERMLKRVLELIGKYERHFAGGGSAVADPQATYAYTKLLRTAMELSREMSRYESSSPVLPGEEAGMTKGGELR